MKLIQITDPHLTLPGETLFGLDPHARLDACLDHVAKHHGDVDLVIVTGDLTHDGEPAAYAALAERLGGFALPFRLMLGNHDDRGRFAAAFPALAPDGGFFQGFVDTAEGRLILLDTLEAGRVEGHLSPERLHWLDRTLAGTGGRPAFVFMHHPPFPIHVPALDAVRLADAERFAAVLARHENVRHIFAGHVHRPSAGTWNGIGFTTLFGTCQQSAALFSENRFETSLEPPSYGVVFIDAATVTVHFVSFMA
ncbi:phosphodiesterase [Aurantimonas aggregata]|uniref:Phosphodiesterase n=1 Tax=Aurantimonas aggregata TaxID=2047720 RepID=A0A6L9MKF9_9HYPH|nr:phosphodiesterase [Aurantimonas aggregata]